MTEYSLSRFRNQKGRTCFSSLKKFGRDFRAKEPWLGVSADSMEVSKSLEVHDSDSLWKS
jgi:hypothetical protein